MLLLLPLRVLTWQVYTEPLGATQSPGWVRRPVGSAIRIASVLVLLSGIFSIVAGILVLALIGVLNILTPSPSTALATAEVEGAILSAVALALGIVLIILSRRLRTGSKRAADYIVALSVLSIITGMVSWMLGNPLSLIGVATNGLVLLLLFTGWRDLS